MKNKENKINKGINLKFNSINNYSFQRNDSYLFHKCCKRNLKGDLYKNKSVIIRPRNKFYNSFDEKERNPINNLLESTEELNNFKAKIENIEKRNEHYERMLKNENHELIQENRQKEEIIQELNEKEKENLKRINDFKFQLMTNKNVNNKLEKIIKRKDETENIYSELLKRKDEKIQKLIQDKIKLTETIKLLKKN